MSRFQNTRRVLNIDILSITSNSLLENLSDGVMVTPNIDHLVKLQNDREFYQFYQRAKWIICDSRVLYFFLKLFGNSIRESISGSSFFSKFCEFHKNNQNCKVFLLGGVNGIANIAKDNINSKIERNIIVDSLSPSLGFEDNHEEIDFIVDSVNASGANIVVVGLGAPKQEKFIFQYKERMPNVKLWMALGATIDYEAGYKKRAPRWMQNIALEWLYRLLCEPRRLFKRYLIDDPKFFWYFLKQILGLYKNPFKEIEHTK